MSAAPQLPVAPDAHAGEVLDLETARPSVTITRNAKGQAQWTVKVYGVDSSETAADVASSAAQRIYDELTVKYGSGS